MTEETQENSVEPQETYYEEPLEEPLESLPLAMLDIPKPTKKPKRIMSEAQKQNLIKARQKAAELRNQLKQKKPPPPKKMSKLEKELQNLTEEPDIEPEVETKQPKQEDPIEVKETPKQEEQQPYRAKLVKSDDGFFYIV